MVEIFGDVFCFYCSSLSYCHVQVLEDYLELFETAAEAAAVVATALATAADVAMAPATAAAGVDGDDYYYCSEAEDNIGIVDQCN